MLGLLPGLKSLLPGYYEHKPLEIFSHTNYNTASAEIIEQVLCRCWNTKVQNTAVL
jgi:hypothetical protein